MSKQPNRDYFLVGKKRFALVTQPLKTGVETGIVDFDRQTGKLKSIDFP